MSSEHNPPTLAESGVALEDLLPRAQQIAEEVVRLLKGEAPPSAQPVELVDGRYRIYGIPISGETLRDSPRTHLARTIIQHFQPSSSAEVRLPGGKLDSVTDCTREVTKHVQKVLARPHRDIGETQRVLKSMHDFLVQKARDSGVPGPGAMKVELPLLPLPNQESFDQRGVILDGVYLDDGFFAEGIGSVQAYLWTQYMDTVPSLEWTLANGSMEQQQRWLEALSVYVTQQIQDRKLTVPPSEPWSLQNGGSVFGISLTPEMVAKRYPGPILMHKLLQLLERYKERLLTCQELTHKITHGAVRNQQQTEIAWLEATLMDCLRGTPDEEGFGRITGESVPWSVALPDASKQRSRHILYAAVELDRTYPDGGMHRILRERIQEAVRNFVMRDLSILDRRQLHAHVHTVIGFRSLFSLSVSAAVSVYDL